MTVSVLILTLDEEVNLAGCLASLAWCDDVVVLDSYSTDGTVALAQALGARVVQRRFDDYASQRNHGLQQIDYKHSWILMLDADERVTPELRDEMLQAAASAEERVAMFMMRRKDHLFGRWLRRSSGYPTWFGRLVRRGRVWVERPINEEYRTEGERRLLQGHIEHHPYNKGFSNWIAKHDRYSGMEAALLHAGAAELRPWKELLSRDAPVRRRAIKSWAYRVPGRPLLMFLALYLVRGGILEGRAGLTVCVLRAWYEFLIDCKRRELARRALALPV